MEQPELGFEVERAETVPAEFQTGHHPHWPKVVFKEDRFRDLVFETTTSAHDQFHERFKKKCGRVLGTGAFLCEECEDLWNLNCGWGIMIYSYKYCCHPNCSSCSVSMACLHAIRTPVFDITG